MPPRLSRTETTNASRVAEAEESQRRIEAKKRVAGAVRAIASSAKPSVAPDLPAKSAKRVKREELLERLQHALAFDGNAKMVALSVNRTDVEMIVELLETI